MLKVGEVAPPFAAGSTTGAPVSLEVMRGRILVLYFFHRAFTHKCTIETKGFRDNYPDLRAVGAEVIGVSSDDFGRQCEFARFHDVNFPMIADADHAIQRDYRVRFAFLARRVTYVIDPRGIVAGVFHHEFQISKHLDEVLLFVRSMARP
jgi:peroxiredoxin Q/BCP